MRATREHHRSRAAVVLPLCALAWSALLVPAALILPVYSSQTTDSRGGEPVDQGRTLVEVNGPAALAPIAAVILVAAVGALALARSRGSTRRTARRVAIGAVAALLIFGAVGAASIGIFVLPAAIALGVAARRMAAVDDHRATASN